MKVRNTVVLSLLILSVALQVSAIELFGFNIPKLSKSSFKKELGKPLVYEEKRPKHLQSCSQEEQLKASIHNPCHPRYHLEFKYNSLIKTDLPTIAVLTQPINQLVYEGADSSSDTNMLDSYISAAHVRYLEAAGARAVVLSYRYTHRTLIKILKQVNAVYIPGESDILLQNPKYMDTISKILEFASQAHRDPNNHFPVMAVSYGYLAVI